jgi:uncharacterized lipoprotein YajG
MKLFALLAVVLLTGCGVTRSAITTTTPDGTVSTCTATTMTLSKDISGAKMNCSTTSGWQVDNSEPNIMAMQVLAGAMQTVMKGMMTGGAGTLVP